MLLEQKKAIHDLFTQALNTLGVTDINVVLERPKVAEHGDLACNVAMQMARALKKNPREIATNLVETLQANPETAALIQSFEIAGPGFINMRLSDEAKSAVVKKVLQEGATYGQNQDHNGESILIEYVSVTY